MKTANRLTWLPAAFIAVMFASTNVLAEAGNYSSDVNLKPILKLIAVGDFDSAIDDLHNELDIDPDNPDIMALLGFSYRKSGNFEDALTFYQWALRSAPEHIGANEYLGELYLQTNEFDKAVQQLDILDNLCRSGCKEFTKLKNAIDSYASNTASSS